ncbi:MAG: cytochrome c [Bacteroidia bacterium]|nr:cytochrome c [Bacteroidia bacterium]MDW8133957.1 cytochrome c [Bacteroidia bacterium]
MRHSISVVYLIVSGAIFIAACASQDPRDPGIEYAPQMYHSIPLEPYSQIDYHQYTPDGKHLLSPVQGTVARKKISYFYPFPNTNEGYEEAGKKLTNPLPKTPENVAEGKRLYELYCIHCHGEKGDGQGSIVQAGKFPPPPSYYGVQLRDLPEGKMFHSITYGKNLMGSHASQLSPEERWKVIMYVQELRKAGLAQQEGAQVSNPDGYNKKSLQKK